MEVHHIGYLVKHMAEAKEGFLKLSYEIVQEEVFDAVRGVTICFLEKDGYRVELISPKDKTSVVYSLLKHHRNSPYHICYLSPCFEEELKSLCEAGYTLMGEPLEAPALGNRRVAFLMHYEIGMIEVLEEERQTSDDF